MKTRVAENIEKETKACGEPSSGTSSGSRFEGTGIKAKEFELLTRHCRYTDDTVCTAAVAASLLEGLPPDLTLRVWCHRHPGPGLRRDVRGGGLRARRGRRTAASGTRGDAGVACSVSQPAPPRRGSAQGRRGSDPRDPRPPRGHEGRPGGGARRLACVPGRSARHRSGGRSNMPMGTTFPGAWTRSDRTTDST